MMSRLKSENGIFLIDKKIPFKENILDEKLINEVFEFAYEMAFGEGYHRRKRSGGSAERSQLEIFANTLQGKLAESILNNELISNGIETSGVDMGIYGKGIWDHGDLVANRMNINVKSMVFFSNLFMLECEDWDLNGNYIPDNKSFTYDYFVCVRIKPNIKTLFANKEYDKEELFRIIEAQNFYFDIPGVFSIHTLREIIKKGYVIKKGQKLNQTIMDADNYYIQSGDLKCIDEMYDQLKL